MIDEKVNYFNEGPDTVAKMLDTVKPLSIRHLLKFNKKDVAVLVLDMQKAYVSPESTSRIPAVDYIVPNILKIISKYNKNLIIFTRHTNSPKNAKMMSKWWRTLISEKSVQSELFFDHKGAIVVEKNQYDAFYNTDLEEILEKNKIKQVIITGVMTNLCCESTARSAFERGYEVFFVVDAMATRNYNLHMSAIMNAAHGFAHPISTESLLK